MKKYLAIPILFWYCLRYMAYRLGWRDMPPLWDVRHQCIDAFDVLFNFNKNLRLVNPERYHSPGPALISSNHFCATDPLFLYGAIHRITNRQVVLHPVMREGFFGNSSLLKSRLLDVDEALRSGQVIQFDRGDVRLSQLKPAIEVLRNRETLVLYPGRTRSRSGLLIEYPEPGQGPAASSFFVAGAQRRDKDLTVDCLPVTRTRNPVTGATVFVFGKPIHLPPGARRGDLAAFDLELAALLTDLVELNVPQLVSGLIYLRCLHGQPPETTPAELAGQIRRVIETAGHPYVDPAIERGLESELRQTLHWLNKAAMLEIDGERVRIDRQAVLAAPPMDSTYKKTNPVKYLTNQLVQLPHVTRALEQAVLTPQ